MYKLMELKFNPKFKDYTLSYNDRPIYLGDLDEITAVLISMGVKEVELARVYSYMSKHKHFIVYFDLFGRFISSK
jgi:hypothetical protein